jgi:hypothetical protein
VLTTAPNAVIEVIVCSDQAEAFVRIVPVNASVVFPLGKRETPVLNVDVLASLVFHGLCEKKVGGNDGDGRSVEIRPDLPACQRKKGGSQIGVRSNNITEIPFRNIGTAHYQRYVDILLETAFFAGLETVLANMVAVVGRCMCLRERRVRLDE